MDFVQLAARPTQPAKLPRAICRLGGSLVADSLRRSRTRRTSLREARHAICRANQAKVDALASRRQRRHEAMYERRLDGLFEQKSRWLQSVGSMGRPAATVEAAH